MRWMIALLLAACVAAAAAGAPAERISAARAAAVAQERFAGDVIDVELDDAERHEPGDEVYEVKLLTASGDVVSVRISAETGDYLGAEARDLGALARTAPKRAAP